MVITFPVTIFHKTLTSSIAMLLICATLAAPSTSASTALWKETETAKHQLSITVARGKWGQTTILDIHRLLVSVASEFHSYAGFNRARDIDIRVVPRNGSPRVLYERGTDGSYVIHLTARDDRWYQYAYQFAHELCHIYSNFDHKERDKHGSVSIKNQWFEESLCEAAAVHTLKRLALSWEHNPPTRSWIGYSQIFANYADYLLRQPHRQLPESLSLIDWYQKHHQVLRANPYLREKNEQVATRMLRIFEQNPQFWSAIGYLNQNPASAGRSFADYLADWQKAAPAQQKMLPTKIMALFGINTDNTYIASVHRGSLLREQGSLSPKPQQTR
ncbi:MAG: hypothetical protein V7739_22160 [Motiliproteus sp.]